YEHQPSEAAIFALGKARDVYGVRRITLDPEANTIRVEYDATRLNKQTVHQILRRAGVGLIEELSLLPPQPVAEPELAAPAQAK
ncbi:MAG TPA: hypothetical protein VFT88_08335, partial [Acidobacteriaceae bacterium]|nr:hypothetical protein [Acidobacteriaceae bacterium]